MIVPSPSTYASGEYLPFVRAVMGAYHYFERGAYGSHCIECGEKEPVESHRPEEVRRRREVVARASMAQGVGVHR